MPIKPLERGDIANADKGAENVAAFTQQTAEDVGELSRKYDEQSAQLAEANGKIDQLDTALAQANETMDALKRRAAPSDAQNAELVRRFYSENADSMTDDARGQIARSQVGQLGEGRNRPWLGNADGVVRMYGGYDEPGNERSYREGLMDSAPVNDWHAELQELSEMLVVARYCGVDNGKIRRQLKRHLARGPEPIARMFANNSGEGAELLPDMTMPVLDREAQEARRLAAAFSVRSVGPGGDHRNPFQLYNAGQAFKRGTPASGLNDFLQLQASQVALTTAPYSVPTLAGLFLVNEPDAEDAIIMWWPEARRTAVSVLVDVEEDAIINGVDASTITAGAALLDSALATWDGGGRWPILNQDTDHRLSFDGLRRIAAINSCEGAVSDNTSAGFLADAANLDAPYRKGNLVRLTSSKYEIGTLLKDTDLYRVDGSGSAATRLTGAVGTLGGRDVMTSEFVSEELATSGRYTGSGSTTLRMTFDADQFEIVQRRGITTVLGSRPETLTGFMAFHQRRGFRFKVPTGASKKKAVYVGFNI